MSRPITGADSPVTLINAFTVPPEQSERFLDWYKETAPIMTDKPGFVRGRLYRSLADDVELRFINVTDWESGTALDVARADPTWLTAVRRIFDDPDLNITARPVVYEVVIEVHAGDQL